MLAVAPDYSQAVNIPLWLDGGAVWRRCRIRFMCALLCSHLAAFRVATNLRLTVTGHLAKLPLDLIRLAAETHLAHQLPDQHSAMVTPVGLLVRSFVFDWRLGLLSLIPVFLGFAIMTVMTGQRMAEKCVAIWQTHLLLCSVKRWNMSVDPGSKNLRQSVFSCRVQGNN